MSGSFRTLGMNIAWDEHPFEWVKDREHSVYREYTAGPLRALWNRATLTPLEGGGTRLVHEVRALPGGVIGRVAAHFELRLKLARRMEEVYRRFEAALAEGPAFTGDPFEALHSPSNLQREVVQDACQRLAERHGFGEDVVSRLSDLLLFAPEKRLERLRPWELADAWKADRGDVLDMMFVATGIGILQLAWDLVCPRCQVSHEVAPTLGRVTPRGVCAACNAAYEIDLATTVELVFRPHRAVRQTDNATYCVGAPARRPHVIAQQVLAPGEERTVSVHLPRGDYRITGPRVTSPRVCAASQVGWAGELVVEVGVAGVDVRPAVVRAGEVTLRLTNATEHDQFIRVESTAQRGDAVTAAAALAHPRFREFFSEELLPYGEHVTVSRVAFLFLDVPGRFALLDDKGDVGSLAFAGKLDALVAEHAAARQGSIVESSSDLRPTVVIFRRPRALDAGLRDPHAAPRRPASASRSAPPSTKGPASRSPAPARSTGSATPSRAAPRSSKKPTTTASPCRTAWRINATCSRSPARRDASPRPAKASRSATEAAAWCAFRRRRSLRAEPDSGSGLRRAEDSPGGEGLLRVGDGFFFGFGDRGDAEKLGAGRGVDALFGGDAEAATIGQRGGLLGEGAGRGGARGRVRRARLEDLPEGFARVAGRAVVAVAARGLGEHRGRALGEALDAVVGGLGGAGDLGLDARDDRGRARGIVAVDLEAQQDTVALLEDERRRRRDRDAVEIMMGVEAGPRCRSPAGRRRRGRCATPPERERRRGGDRDVGRDGRRERGRVQGGEEERQHAERPGRKEREREREREREKVI